MLRKLPSALLGPIVLFLMFLNTLFWVIPLYTITFIKLLIPISDWRRFSSQILVRIAENWIATNNAIFHHTQHTQWHIQGVEGLAHDDWYLVSANHQTWLDIFVLQRVFNRRIPFLKFFTKQELIWFPLLGPAWWALDFPFMKRYSKEKLAIPFSLLCGDYTDDPAFREEFQAWVRDLWQEKDKLMAHLYENAQA